MSENILYEVAHAIIQRAFDQTTVQPDEDYARTLDRVKTTLEVGLMTMPPPTTESKGDRS